MAYGKPDHIKFELKTFTEKEIERLLEASMNFRRMNHAHRYRILTALRMGWWDACTGDTLAFTKGGMLVDGQHRLSAAQEYQKETGERLWFWCAIGVSEDSGKNMDQGLVRKLVDYLKSDNVKYPAIVAQIVAAQSRVAMQPRSQSNTLSVVAGGSPRIGKGLKSTVPSVSYCMDQYQGFSKSFAEWGVIGQRMKDKGFSRHGLLASLGFQFAKTHDMEAKLFFDNLLTGVSLKPGDPILTLRDRIAADYRASTKEKLPASYVAAYTVKAWVAWNQGSLLSSLRWSPSGPRAEAFPSHRFEAVE